MTDCIYKVTGKQDGINQLVCRHCGHETRSAYGPELVHTRCRVSPTLAELIERVRRDIAERLNAERLDPELPAMMPEIVRRAVICHTNRCDKFNDQTCTDRGGACTHWVRWMERLSFGQCEQWREGT